MRRGLTGTLVLALLAWWIWRSAGPAQATPPLTATHKAIIHNAATHGAATLSAAARLAAAREALSREARIVEPLPLVPVPRGGESIGAPGRGRLRHGVQLPDNPALYVRRTPEHAWGSTYALENLQRAIAIFRRDTGYDQPLVVSDISRRRGGRLRPHGSHQSGRDVDLWLPLAPDVPPDTVPRRIQDVDWAATWGLLRALLDTESVQYIFLSRSRQRQVYRVARELGVAETYLSEVLQFPSRRRVAVIRHERGHRKHMHVRFRCAEHERRCR